MGWSMLEIVDDPLEGELLIAGGETRKGGAWIARITGTHPTYKYEREFLGEKEYGTYGKGTVVVKVPLAELEEGDLLDIRTGGSWKNEYRDFYVYENGDIRRIKEQELRKRLAEKMRKAQEGIDKVEALHRKREELAKALALTEAELAMLTEIKEKEKAGDE